MSYERDHNSFFGDLEKHVPPAVIQKYVNIVIINQDQN
jgi:hypothetical protein